MILGINTSTLQFSLALMNNRGCLVGEIYLSTGKRHFGGLFPSLDFLLHSLDKRISDITCVAVALGPGSFTGLRVGLSSAKGLAHALDVPIVGINSLEALAIQVPHSSLPITALIESRRNDVFVAQFHWTSKSRLTRIGENQCLEYESLKGQITLPSIFVGNNYETQYPKLKESIPTGINFAPSHSWSVRASSVCSLGLRRFLDGELDDMATLVPIYLRPPDIRANPYFQREGIASQR